jgi:hypothetical protein
MSFGLEVSLSQVTLLIESITDVSEVNMDLTITFVIYQTWTDPRLGLYRTSGILGRQC